MHIMPTKWEKLQHLELLQQVGEHCFPGPLALLAPYPPRDSSHSFPSVLRNLLDFILCSFPQSHALWSLWEVIAQYLLDSVISVVWLNTHTIFDLQLWKFFPAPLSPYSVCILDLGPDSKLPVRQGSVKSAAYSLLLLHVELSREEPSQRHFSFPFSSPFPLTSCPSWWSLSWTAHAWDLNQPRPAQLSEAQGSGVDRWQVFHLPGSLRRHNWLFLFLLFLLQSC